MCTIHQHAPHILRLLLATTCLNLSYIYFLTNHTMKNRSIFTLHFVLLPINQTSTTEKRNVQNEANQRTNGEKKRTSFVRRLAHVRNAFELRKWKIIRQGTFSINSTWFRNSWEVLTCAMNEFNLACHQSHSHTHKMGFSCTGVSEKQQKHTIKRWSRREQKIVSNIAISLKNRSKWVKRI